MGDERQAAEGTRHLCKAGTGATAIIVWALAALGCSIHWMPLEAPAPRELILPDLMDRCRRLSAGQTAIELLSSGDPPRRRMRMAPIAGLESQIPLLLGPDFDGPALRIDTEWAETGATGNSCHRFVLQGGLDPEDDPADPIVGVMGTSPLGAFGVWTDGLDPTSQRVESELAKQLAWVEPLLPPRAIGVGAVWRHHDEGWLDGEYLQIDVRYRLLTVDGNRLRVRVERRTSYTPDTTSARATSSGAGRTVEMRVALIDFDLRRRPFPSGRVFDPAGREVLRVLPAYR